MKAELREYLELLDDDKREYALRYWNWLAYDGKGERPITFLYQAVRKSIEYRLYKYMEEFKRV